MSKQHIPTESYYHQSIDDLILKFNADINNGLKSEELEARYLKYGYNELPKIKKSLWKIYLAPIFNFLIVILLITGVMGTPASPPASALKPHKRILLRLPTA